MHTESNQSSPPHSGWPSGQMAEIVRQRAKRSIWCAQHSA